MYIDNFLFGVIVCILAELGALIVYAIVLEVRKRKRRKAAWEDYKKNVLHIIRDDE